MTAVADRVIECALKQRTKTKRELLLLCRSMSRGLSRMPATDDLRRAYQKAVFRKPNHYQETLERLLQRTAVRSVSGVSVITVLTKPWPCPGQCLYCPDEARMPKSYLSNEPAAARALGLQFDPWRQVTVRLRALKDNGHPNDKIELIVKGGTWSAYPTKYQDWFIKRCFDAANNFKSGRKRAARTLQKAQDINERAGHRIIGLTLETRPDRIMPQEIVRLRRLGCTRIEMGIQSLNDRILEASRRGHDSAASARATWLLKLAGFKVDYHLMPQLPGATPKIDRGSLRQVFADCRFRPDMVKVYPCVVIETAELHKQWEAGKYRPYSNRMLMELLVRFKTEIPRYCRISRLIRDIPSTSVLAGNPTTNLRQAIQARMSETGLQCNCLRCREIGHISKQNPRLAGLKPRLFDDSYETAGGLERFLSLEDSRRRAVFAFCRLRLPNKISEQPDPKAASKIIRQLPELAGAALIRELHTYGHLVPIGQRRRRASQHTGLGKGLMAEAERLAAEAGYSKMAVIAGIGVRSYYRKLGYRLKGHYMVKKLPSA